MTLLTLIASALAAPPGPILAAVELPDLPGAYKEMAEGRGLEGARTEIACRDLIEGELLLCFRVVDGGKRRYVRADDMATWGMDLVALERAAAGALTENPLLAQSIEGGGTWYVVAAPAGRELTVLLHPEWLKTLGPRPVVGVPAAGVVMGWSAGDQELDTIMAVGVRRAFETQERPLTPLCLEWTGDAWRAWGEAKPGE